MQAKKRRSHFKDAVNDYSNNPNGLQNAIANGDIKLNNGQELLNYSIDRFNDDFGYEDDDIDVFGVRDAGDEMGICADDRFAYNSKGFKSPHGEMWHNKNGDFRRTNKGTKTKGNRDKTLGKDTLARKAFDRGAKEIDDFNNDNYEYIKGKGWQLK